jgi:hypothetical protein
MPVCLSFDCQGLSLLQVESFPLDLLQPPCLLPALVFGKHGGDGGLMWAGGASLIVGIQE